MTKCHVVAALLAFGSLAALPACTTMDGRTGGAAQMSSPGLSPTLVSQVQTKLRQDGFYAGNIDGVWGPQTRSALQNFQAAHALRATGELDQPTFAAINAPASSMAPAMQPAAAAPAPVTSPTASVAPTMMPPMALAMPSVTTSGTAPAIAPAE